MDKLPWNYFAIPPEGVIKGWGTQQRSEAMNRTNDYFQIKLTDDHGDIYYFYHDRTEDRSLITADEESSDLVGQHEIRKVIDSLIARGWRRDQMEFTHVGGMVEGGRV